jgi:phosphotriesterase-related protein
MAYIRTVNGDIAPEALGICYPHEHLIGAPPPPYDADDPDLVLDDEGAGVASLKALKEAGGGALVEMTPIDYRRDPAALQRIAARAEMHIIAVTGYLKEKFCGPLVETQTVDALSARFIQEIRDGMDDTAIPAGVIKAASSLDTITDNERKVFLAAAQAQRETGALISTHTEAGTMALEQIALLTGAGVPPQRMLIGHLDRLLDRDYHHRIADTGVYMGFDQIGKAKYAPDNARVAMIRSLIQAGYERQITLSMDIARQSYLPAYGGEPGFPYLLTDFVPLLRNAGVSSETIDVMLKRNPTRALSIESEHHT